MYPNKICFMIFLTNNILFISDLSLCSYCRLCTNYCPQLSNKLILVGLCSFARHLFYHLHHIGRNSSYCMDRRFSNLYHVRWNPCNFCRSSQCHWWPKQCLVSHIYFQIRSLVMLNLIYVDIQVDQFYFRFFRGTAILRLCATIMMI